MLLGSNQVMEDNKKIVVDRLNVEGWGREYGMAHTTSEF